MGEHFYSIYDWMTDELHLDGSVINVFAVINSFTEAGRDYDGGLGYLARRTGRSRQSVCAVLKRLQQKGLIAKAEHFEGAVKYCTYRATYRRPAPQEAASDQKTGNGPFKKQNAPVQESFTEPFKIRNGAVQETLTYYKEDHKDHYKEGIGESAASGAEKPSPAPKNSFGEYGNMRLTEEELAKLKQEFPEDWRQRVERLSAYMASTGKAYKNHLATIRSWALQDAKDRPEKPQHTVIPGGLVL